MQLVKPTPFAEAVAKIGGKTVIGSKMRSDEWSDVPVALRERAFFSSQVENVRFLQRARDGIADFLQGNRETLASGETALKTGSRADFVKQMQSFLEKEGVDRTSGGLTDIAGERRLGLIFDTQTRQANDYGYWRQGQDPDVLNEFPAQRFVRVLDVKDPRDSHTQFEDQVYLKSDPIWATQINEVFGVPWGPWAWGCGHDVEDVDRTEAESQGLLSPGESVQPDVRNFNENLKASTQGLDPDLLTKLKSELGDQLVIDGDEMRWTPSPASNPQSTPAQPATPPTPTPTPAPATAPTPPAPQTRPANPTPPAPAPAAAPPPPPPPPLAQTTQPAGTPISSVLDVQPKTGPLRAEILRAIKAIDSVHGDGTLPQIPVESSRKRKNLGGFQPVRTPHGVEAKHIEIRKDGPWPALTMVHENGHFLDLAGIGPKGNYATNNFAPMQKLITAAKQTAAVKDLQTQLGAASSYHEADHLRYLLSDKEIWARAYAQFVAEKSGDAILLDGLSKAHAVRSGRQWDPKDFAPVSAGIETMFKQLGWMK